MSTLHHTIQELADKFASEIVAALRGVSLDDIASLNGAQPRHVKKAHAGRRRVRRTESDLKGVLAMVVGALRRSQGGLRSEQIQAVLHLKKKDLVRPLALGLSTKTLKKRGIKRATTYHVA